MKKLFTSLFAIIMIALITLVQAPVASAVKVASLADLNTARVSFTFDDGFASTRTLAAPILEARGIDGVLYLTSGVPDGEHVLDDNQPGITWDQVRELQNVYGWEIGGHTRTHPEMPTISQEANSAELTYSNTRFTENGLNVTNFASPFGAYDNTTLPEILKYYKSHRGFADREALNTTPYNKSVLMVQDVDNTVTPAQVQAWVDQAIAEKRWLVLTFHDTAVDQNANYQYTVTTADLTAMANYVQTKAAAGEIDVVTVEEGITLPGANVLQNSGFEAGIANGWSTDNAAAVQADNNNNGNYGSPLQSISLTGAAANVHLFSGVTPVSTASSYIFETFYNALGLTTGELGFYIDEYDAAGTWVSGQWLGMVTNGTVGFFTALYNATSDLVNSFRVQTYLTGGSTGTAYIDSTNVYNTDAAPATTPTVTPSVTPAPVANAIQNGSFDNGMTNWTTDNPTNVVLDAQAIRFTGNAAAGHLFQNVANINPTTPYNFSANVDATNLTTGELGFYIDEYNTAGTWISGKWLGMATNGVVSTFERLYQATSNLVASIRVQTYLTPNAIGNAKVDNYSLSNQTAVPTATPSGTPSVTPSVTPEPGTNMVQNGTFDNGMTNWTTDNAANVVLDANAIKFTGNAANSHLFQNVAGINNAAQYNFSANVDATALTAGELGFYIDEYDAAGNWISGKWLGMVTNGVVSTIDRIYTVTSNLVNSIRIQTYLTGGAAGTAKVDNYSLSTGTPVAPTATPSGTPTETPSITPSVTPEPTVAPAPGTNLVQNGSFETLANGFAAAWERTVGFVIDSGSNGNDGVSSLHIPANAEYSHAFSQRINITPGATYTWSQFVSTLTGTGELGFYVDEYDAAGNWVSGQWKGMVAGPTTGVQSFTYTPSSAAVSSVRLQYYVTPNSTFNLYVDSVSLSN